MLRLGAIIFSCALGIITNNASWIFVGVVILLALEILNDGL